MIQYEKYPLSKWLWMVYSMVHSTFSTQQHNNMDKEENYLKIQD